MAQNIRNIFANNFTFRCVISIYYFVRAHIFFLSIFYQHLAFFLFVALAQEQGID